MVAFVARDVLPVFACGCGFLGAEGVGGCTERSCLGRYGDDAVLLCLHDTVFAVFCKFVVAELILAEFALATFVLVEQIA